VEKLGDIASMGLFVYHIWRRVARYGFDKTQSSEAHQWTLYLFNGATYERGQWKALKRQAKHHTTSAAASLGSVSRRRFDPERKARSRGAGRPTLSQRPLRRRSSACRTGRC
jgi:hypothetical protein